MTTPSAGERTRVAPGGGSGVAITSGVGEEAAVPVGEETAVGVGMSAVAAGEGLVVVLAATVSVGGRCVGLLLTIA